MGGLSGYADLASERGEFRRSPDFEVGSRLGIDGTKSILGGTPRSPHNGNPKSGITTKGTKDTKRMRGGRFLVSATTPWDRDAFDGPSFVVFVPFVVPYPGIWGRVNLRSGSPHRFAEPRCHSPSLGRTRCRGRTPRSTESEGPPATGNRERRRSRRLLSSSTFLRGRTAAAETPRRHRLRCHGRLPRLIGPPRPGFLPRSRQTPGQACPSVHPSVRPPPRIRRRTSESPAAVPSSPRDSTPTLSPPSTP